MLVDEAHHAYFFCCAEGAIPLTEIHARLRERAEALARAAGMRDPAVYARWLLRQCGFAPRDAMDDEDADAPKAQVMRDAHT